MDEPSQRCAICELNITDDEIELTSQLRSSLFEASRKRGDNNVTTKFRQLGNYLHSRCYRNYTHYHQIDRAVAKKNDEVESAKENISANANVEKGDINTFNFNLYCIFCRQDASDDFIKAQQTVKSKKKVEVSKITRASTIEKIEKLFTNADPVQFGHVKTLLKDFEGKEDQMRYHRKCIIEYYKPYTKTERLSTTDTVVQYIMNFLQQNREKPQYSLDEILENFEGDVPTHQFLTQKFLEKYKDDVFVSTRNQKYIFCCKETASKILSQHWHESRNKDPQAERKRILSTAVDILFEGARSQACETGFYPSPSNFLSNVDNEVPSDLKFVVQSLLQKNKKKTSNYNSQIVSITHAIMSGIRPRQFLSSLQVCLGFVLMKKYGSKDLINLLNSLGFCASYSECLVFENSFAMHLPNPRLLGSFKQYVFDNADHNVNTLDGHRTLHVMGGIEIVTPAAIAGNDSVIIRKPRISLEEQKQFFTSIPLTHYHRDKSMEGLKSIKIFDLQRTSPIDPYDLNLLATDFLWLYAKHINYDKVKGWNSYMEELTHHLPCEKSRIILLPFIHAPAGDYDTIYTALQEAAKRCREAKQKFCFVTFDQPLYWKAREIMASSANDPSFKDVRMVIRLGGFHLLMSYIGSIGYIMDGSGIKHLFSVYYAMNSTDKMLNGHFYARAVRAHTITHLALFTLIAETVDFNDEDKAVMEKLLGKENKSDIIDQLEDESFQRVYKKFTDRLNEISEISLTAKLWVLLFRMETLIKQFIEGERTWNWKLHLEVCRKMIPIFHAAGHFLYAKSVQLYLQDMEQLDLSETEIKTFIEQSFFTVRRTEAFRRGVWTDMCIEQTLMKSMKSAGGLTRGRGASQAVISRWLHTVPGFFDLSEQLYDFSNISFSTSSEQHVDASDARVEHDNDMLQKFLGWLRIHNPFKDGEKDIYSLSTGMKGDATVNCHDAIKIGLASLSKIIGSNMKDVKFSRKNRVVNLSQINTARISSEPSLKVDTALVFQRIALLKGNENDLIDCFNYELATYPPSLFCNSGMRKNKKADLYASFTPIENDIDFGRYINLLDGGFLLHRVIWESQTTFEQILCKYVQYVKYTCQPGSIVIFDGYPEDPALQQTKSVERVRRASKKTCADYNIDSSLTPVVTQASFLSNDHNKRQLIDLLKEKLQEQGFLVLQAIEDADAMIVHTAMEKRQEYDSIVIIGEDIDLLVILTQISPPDCNVYFLKPNAGSVPTHVYNHDSFNYPSIKKHIAFIHAYTGCDTTSAFFYKGKLTFINILLNDRELQFLCERFCDDAAFGEYISCIGDKITSAFYGVAPDIEKGLNRLRYDKFQEKTIANTFDLARLPPTAAANKQHCLRVYYQIKQWTHPGNCFDAEKYGWRKTINGLLPVTTLDKLLPKLITKSVSCKCAKGCNNRCSCRKNGAYCTQACKNCEGKNCSNCVPLTDFGEEIDEGDLLDNEIEKLAEEKDSGSEQSEVEEENGYDDYDDPAYAIVYDDTDAESDQTDSDAEPCFSMPKRARKK